LRSRAQNVSQISNLKFQIPFCAKRKMEGAPLLPKLRGYFAEFLREVSLARLSLFDSPTCVGLRYGQPGEQQKAFLGRLSSDALRPRAKLSIRLPSHFSLCVPFCLNPSRCRNINLLCIDYALRPRLSSRLTLGGRTCPRKP
jgi:hypothetical protein